MPRTRWMLRVQVDEGELPAYLDEMAVIIGAYMPASGPVLDVEPLPSNGVRVESASREALLPILEHAVATWPSAQITLARR